MLEALFAPLRDLGPLILRVALGVIFLAHGWPKLNPAGPMKGPAGVAGFFKQIGVPMPLFFAWVVALLETVGAVLLILGLGTRIVALAFAVDMLVAIVRARRPMGAPFTSFQTMGWELEFALLAQSLALVFIGAGAIALDRMLGL